jgi:ABC-type uncharacterized transport system permease subunit
LELIVPSQLLSVVPMVVSLVVLVQMKTDPKIDVLVLKAEIDADQKTRLARESGYLQSL